MEGPNAWQGKPGLQVIFYLSPLFFSGPLLQGVCTLWPGFCVLRLSSIARTFSASSAIGDPLNYLC